jgi:hypothetical protein
MSGKRSIRAEKTPPQKSKGIKQMVDVGGFPLTTEQGAPLVTEKETYRKSQYGAATSNSVVVNSDSYQLSGLSTENVFSKGSPAALPVIEQFPVESEVAKSLLGVNRETTQRGLFSNVSTYGLDPKDWRVDVRTGQSEFDVWWNRRPSASGNYYPSRFIEDDKNNALVLDSNPTPFNRPPSPSLQDQLINPGGGERYTTWGQYLNSLVALYLFKYMVRNFTRDEWRLYNLLPMLTKYPPIENGDGTFDFNELYWDKIWLDIQQNRFGPISDYPVIPSGRAFNFNNVVIENWRSNTSIWGSSNVFIVEANSVLPTQLNASWDNFFFSTTRTYFPEGQSDNKGHYRLKTNPNQGIWERYFGLRWAELRQDLKDWEFKVHPNENSVTQLEKDLKLPYFIVDTPRVPDTANNVFSNSWPSETFGPQINLPTNSNRIGGTQVNRSEIVLRSIRAFRYQPGRISGFTYGVRLSDVGAGPGTILEFGIENDTDAYLFQLANGSNLSIVRRSTIPLDNTEFLESAGYFDTTKTITRNGKLQYETVISQNIMNGDPLSGEGKTGYILDPDKVTMYKIEFGWYGAIGARFYVYAPVENDECRWITLHTLVIENQLGKPCLADPFFYFSYRLQINDSSAIRIKQFVYKFGASYYIDGYDEGTLYTLNAQSKVRNLRSPDFSILKTSLNAIDWTTILGIKPRQFLVNRFGTSLLNKKEIFPSNLTIYSQQDCEIKIVRQRGCPGWAYSNQEGYFWNILPTSRRLKGKFFVNQYVNENIPEIGLSQGEGSAIALYSQASTGGFRNPAVESNWEVIGDQAARIIGTDLYGLFPGETKDFSGGSLSIKLQRDKNGRAILTSRTPFPEPRSVFLPFTYAQVGEFANGYDIEFDYHRRDQTLLSSVDVLSDEFYIYWTGGFLDSLVSAAHSSSLRIGFCWPNTTDPESPIYATQSDLDWGIEKSDPVLEYDGQKFYEGLPHDFVQDFPENTLFVENNPLVVTNTFNFESGEFRNYFYTRLSESDAEERLNVPGQEGGICRGLLCKSGREIRKNVNIVVEGTPEEGIKYFINDPQSAWPNTSPENFEVTLSQGSVVANVSTTGGITRSIEGGVRQYLLPIGSSLPVGISPGNVVVSYNIVYIANIDKKSRVRNILVSKIAPGDIPFIRVFLQGRQGTRIGGVWIGQKTSRGIDLSPFTPHRSTFSISDLGTDYHSQWSDNPESDGSVKCITPITQNDPRGLPTSPTFDASELSLDTFKSIHTNPRKCGSFLSSGEVNSAGIFTPSDYPIRWLSSGQGDVLATYYVSSNTATDINLTSIFNVFGESVVNDDDANLATFFIARSLSNHDETENEIYASLNYFEQ